MTLFSPYAISLVKTKFVSARAPLQRTRSDGQAFKPAPEAGALPNLIRDIRAIRGLKLTPFPSRSLLPSQLYLLCRSSRSLRSLLQRFNDLTLQRRRSHSCPFVVSPPKAAPSRRTPKRFARNPWNPCHRWLSAPSLIGVDSCPFVVSSPKIFLEPRRRDQYKRPQCKPASPPLKR
jgi:hypothetical protein